MAFSTPKTLAQLRTSCRNMLMDPSARVWSTADIDHYINEWQYDIQNELELIKATSTFTTTSTTTAYPLSTFGSDIHRLDAVYWNGQRLTPRSSEDLFQLKPTYTRTTESGPGVIVIMDDTDFEVWPPPAVGTHTLVAEYVKVLTLTTATDTCEIPAWATYTCPYYVAMRGYARDGPLNDINKSRTYAAVYTQRLDKLRSIKRHLTPKHFPVWQPAKKYQSDVLLARRRST